MRLDFAEWHGDPTSVGSINHHKNGLIDCWGVVIHIMVGHLGGSDTTFRKSKDSAHFGTGKNGALWQWVDTNDEAEAQRAGNPHYWSIENEDFPTNALNDVQLNDCARILTIAHLTKGVPLQVINSPNGRGLGWHGMGGAAWGGHEGCPGPIIVGQLPEIVHRAQDIVNFLATLGHSTPGAIVQPVFNNLTIDRIVDINHGRVLTSDGAVYCGRDASYAGGANGKDFFVGRTAARFADDPPRNYTIVATSGERYDF